MKDLKEYDKGIVRHLFPNETIDFGVRVEDKGYSYIFLTEDEHEDLMSPGRGTIIITYHNITDEQRNRLITNKPSYMTVEEFEPPIYKRYISKVYRLISNPSLEQRVEKMNSFLAEYGNSTNEIDQAVCKLLTERLLELQGRQI